jgi:hypothetical protein
MGILTVYILGRHSEKNVIRPSLTHACAVWMPLSSSSKKALESWQYRAAKIILRTKMNIPRSALLLELGWEPITAFIDRSKVSYFKRLSELPVSRLCKQVYNKMIMLNATFWNLAKYNLYAWALTPPTKISVVSIALLLEINSFWT